MAESNNLNIPGRGREEQNLDVKSFLRKYTRYWYFFVIAFIIAFFGARTYNWYKTPVYGVTAKLLIKDEQGSTDLLLEELDVVSPSKNIENEIEILQSHNLLARTLDKLDFEVSYFLIGDVKVSEVYTDCPFHVEISQIDFSAYSKQYFIHIIDQNSFSFSYKMPDGEEFTKQGEFGKIFTFDQGEITIQRRNQFSGALFNDPNFDKRNYRIAFNTIRSNQNYYLSKLTVGMARSQSTILQLYLEDKVPQKSIDFLNKHIEVYLENDIEIKNKSASATASFLDDQLDLINRDLQAIESSRESFKVSKGIVDLESESQIVLESIKQIDRERAENSGRLNMVRYLENYVESNNNVEDLAPSALDINDPLLNKLISKLSELQSQRKNIVNQSTANNPELVSLDAEIELTRNSLIENVRNITKSLEQKDEEFEMELRKFEGRVQRIPGTERELLEIERELGIQESLYLFLLQKRAELSISLAASQSDNRLIDSARVMPGPISPVPERAYTIAILLAILIPVLIIFILEMFNDRVMDINTIKKITSIPLLGTVGYSVDADPLVSISKPRSSIAEAYRSIRTNLNFFTHNNPSNVLLVTSSVSTEGKTFTAMNLAAVLASSGAKTILLGLDLRKPKIVDEFNLQNKIGCSTFLSGHSTLEEIIQYPALIPNLHIIPSGPIPPNPAELILDEKMRELIAALRNKYNHIVIDTPPIGLVSDGLVLTEFADTTIFVVRQNITKKDHLKSADELYKNGKLKNASLLFNAVKVNHSRYGFNAGYGYGYAYGAGSANGYYDDEPAEKSGWSKLKSGFKK